MTTETTYKLLACRDAGICMYFWFQREHQLISLTILTKRWQHPFIPKRLANISCLRGAQANVLFQTAVVIHAHGMEVHLASYTIEIEYENTSFNTRTQFQILASTILQLMVLPALRLETCTHCCQVNTKKYNYATAELPVYPFFKCLVSLCQSALHRILLVHILFLRISRYISQTSRKSRRICQSFGAVIPCNSWQKRCFCLQRSLSPTSRLTQIKK